MQGEFSGRAKQLAVATAAATASVVSAPAGAQVIDPPVIRPDPERYDPVTEPERDRALSLTQTSPRLAPPGAAETMLTLERVVIEGGTTAFAPEVLEFPFAPLIGREVSVAQLFAAASNVEDLYRGAGYLTSQVIVPAQRVADGTFRIRVIEGFIDKVDVDDEIGPVSKTIEAYGEKLREQKPISEGAIERFANLVADMPGVSGQVVLRPAQRANATGGSDLEYVAERKKFDAFFSVDNRGSELTGPWAFFAGASMNSMTRFADQLQLTFYSTADFDEQVVGQLIYSQLIGPNGLRGGVTLSGGFSNAGGAVEALGFETDTVSVGLFTEYPLYRRVGFSLWAGLSADFVNATTDRRPFFGEPTEDNGLVRAFQDKSRAVSATARWRARVSDKPDWRTTTSGTIAVTRGVDVLDATPDVTTETINTRSRPFGEATYTMLTGDALFNQDVPGPLQIFTRLGGQWASDPLLAIDEFRVGGARFGRGFEPAELTGDSGLGVNFEVQADMTAAAVAAGAPERILTSLAPYAFFDAGVVWNNEPDGDTLTRLGVVEEINFGSATLLSAGLGLRSVFRKNFALDLEAAFPINREVRFDADSEVQFFMRAAAFL